MSRRLRLFILLMLVSVLACLFSKELNEAWQYRTEYGLQRKALDQVQRLTPEQDVKAKAVWRWAKGGTKIYVLTPNEVQSLLNICREDLTVEKRERGGSLQYDELVFEYHEGKATKKRHFYVWFSPDQNGNKLVNKTVRSKTGAFKRFMMDLFEE